MLKSQRRWLTTAATSSISLKQYDEIVASNGSPAEPYVIIGAHGYKSDNVDLVRKAFKVEDAVKQAQTALKIPEQWGAATEAFGNLTPFKEAVPSSETDVLVSRGALNIPAIADMATQMSSACNVAEMYHNPTSHNDVEALKQMAMASVASKPLHIVDHGRIVSRHAIVTCENALDNAANSLQLVDSDPHGAASAYQNNIAIATVAYSYIDKSMITSDLKSARYAADERIKATYSDTFPAILKAVSAAYVPAGV
jgi:hypothetical protein